MKPEKAKKPEAPPIPLPEPAAQEREAIRNSAARMKERHLRLEVRASTDSKGKVTELTSPHTDLAGWSVRFQDAFGSRGGAFPTSEINHLMSAARISDGTLDKVRLNALLAVIDGVQPANEIEAMLASQMAVSHGLIMELVRRATRAEQLPQFEAAGNMAAKLLKAFSGHAELLNKLKRGGEQTVRVEHVHVHSGGQAIVGSITSGANGSTGRGGRGVEKNGNQPHAKAELPAPSASPMPEMRSTDAEREPVQVAGGQGPAALPDARWRAG